MNQIIAELDKVSYQYPGSEEFVLSNISLKINQGEFWGIIGPTGAGKSTLCKALNGIVPQFYGGRFFGSIKINNLDTLDYPISKLASYVGQVFEDPETQLIATSVENEIAFALENLKVSREEILERIPDVLNQVRLQDLEKKHPSELSGGQKQRLAIAAALAIRPKMLVLDEPTSQLDPIGGEEVFSTVRDLNKEFGMTIVMASHSSEEMAEYCDQIVLLSGGEIVKIGTPDEVYSEIDLLYKYDLRPPQVASCFYFMRQNGLDVPSIPVCMNGAMEILPKMTANYNCFSSKNMQVEKKYQGPPLLSLKDLTYVYSDGTPALHDVSLDIREGEYVLIIGQNGAGKSTLVKHFLNLLQPTEGDVTVGEENIRNLTVSSLARRIGYVAQNPDNQIFNSTVGEEVSFALKNLGYKNDEVESRTVESLSSMGLIDYRETHPLALPKGDRARVVIAAILAMKPEIIIFDEPTTGQDYRGAKYILDLSKELHDMGKTVIVITHHLYLMAEYAERVIVMGKGSILLDASIREAFHSIELLSETYLSPPQAVLLSNELNKETTNTANYILTPEEFAKCFSQSAERLTK